MLIQGDCAEVLKQYEDNFFDAIITDPPAGIGFMGKEWDKDKGGRDQWIAWMREVMEECLRVLKPGAHGLVWALPRTSHWTATALEDAGFEIRDVVNHIFGSGFPKSLDISKAIDKAAGAEREVVGHRNPFIDGGKRRTSDKSSSIDFVSESHLKNGMVDVTAPATPEAKQWEGWGTALKPAHEHWILVRKPLSEKTVAKNVLKHGTGGLNIDGCRVETNGEKLQGTIKDTSNWSGNSLGASPQPGVGKWESTQGRFPANLVLSEEAAKELDEQALNLGYGRSAGGGDTKALKNESNRFGKNATAIMGVNNYNDQGGASRFFYVAKASAKDKGQDNKHPTVKSTKLMEYLIKLITPPGGRVLDPFMGSGSTGVAAIRNGFKFLGIEQDEEYFNFALKRIG